MKNDYNSAGNDIKPILIDVIYMSPVSLPEQSIGLFLFLNASFVGL